MELAEELMELFITIHLRTWGASLIIPRQRESFHSGRKTQPWGELWVPADHVQHEMMLVYSGEKQNGSIPD